MIKNIYLHIGLHKTGTSSIQLFLSKNKEKLMKKDRILYFKPRPWPLPFVGGEPKINLRLLGFNYLKSVDADSVVISHENYSWLFDKEDIEKLCGKLKQFADNVYVVLYLRRQDSLAISQKQEGTKWLDNSIAYGHDFQALPKELNYYSKNYLNFYEKVKLWSDTLGKDKVLVRVFDKKKLVGGDVVKDFSELIGISCFEQCEPVGRVNESITRLRQLFLHKTRPWFAEESIEKQYLVKSVLSQDLDDSDKLLPSKQEAISFFENFRNSNEKLKNEFSTDAVELSFSDDFSMYPEVSNAEDLSESQVMEIFSGCIKHLAEENQSYHKANDRESIAFWLRDMATSLENERVDLSLRLMRKALEFKPDGPFIKEKIKQYEGK